MLVEKPFRRALISVIILAWWLPQKTAAQMREDYRTGFEYNYDWIKIDSLNPNNCWQIGAPHKILFNIGCGLWDPTKYKVSKVIVTDTVRPYPPNTFSRFQFEIKKNPYECFGTLSITFEHKYDCDSLHDGGFIELSKDGGNTWENCGYAGYGNYQHFGAVNFYANRSPENHLLWLEPTKIRGEIPAFTGTKKDWEYVDLMYTFYQKDWFRYNSLIVRFTFMSDSIDTGKEGWMIDNLNIAMRISCGEGINENNSKNAIYSVFPNPVTDESELRLPENLKGKSEIDVFDLTGKRIRTYRIVNQQKITIRKFDYRTGMHYFCMRNNNYVVFCGKFIVN
jgi:hypothetical protein